MSGVFDVAALDKQVQRELAGVTIPDGKHGVFFTVGNETGAHAGVAIKVGESWDIGTYVGITKADHHLRYGFQVHGTF